MSTVPRHHVLVEQYVQPSTRWPPDPVRSSYAAARTGLVDHVRTPRRPTASNVLRQRPDRWLRDRQRARGALAVAVGMVFTASLGHGYASLKAHSLVPALPVPAFSTPDSGDVEPRLSQQTTLLPTNCADALAGSVDAAALLGQPAGSMSVRAVLGIGSPSVGVLERVSCRYQRPARGEPPVLLLNLTAFTDPRAALEQRARNIEAEDEDTLSAHQVSLGIARADVIIQRPRILLMVAWDRYTVTATLARGVIADNLMEPVLVDLVQRVLPNLPSLSERTHER